MARERRRRPCGTTIRRSCSRVARGVCRWRFRKSRRTPPVRRRKPRLTARPLARRLAARVGAPLIQPAHRRFDRETEQLLKLCVGHCAPRRGIVRKTLPELFVERLERQPPLLELAEVRLPLRAARMRGGHRPHPPLSAVTIREFADGLALGWLVALALPLMAPFAQRDDVLRGTRGREQRVAQL